MTSALLQPVQTLVKTEAVKTLRERGEPFWWPHEDHFAVWQLGNEVSSVNIEMVRVKAVEGGVREQKTNSGPPRARAEGIAVVSAFALLETLRDQANLVLKHLAVCSALGLEDKS